MSKFSIKCNKNKKNCDKLFSKGLKGCFHAHFFFSILTMFEVNVLKLPTDQSNLIKCVLTANGTD